MPDFSAMIEHLLTPIGLGLLALGTSLGIVVGAIPGLTGAMLIALALPLTFSMSGEHALILLVSMYVGSVSGGLVTATLMRIPGTPASMMTTLDGYPLAQQGRASRALGLGVNASWFGGMFSWIFLVLLAGPMADLSTRFGPFDFFSLVLMALVLIATVSGKSLVKGILSGMIGIFLALPGASPATGHTRLTFGMHELDDGFKLLPVLIGLFAVNQVIQEIMKDERSIERCRADNGSAWMSLQDWSKGLVNLLRSSFIGTGVGILPGVGANIGSVIAYSAAKSASKDPQSFGSGSEEGIIAAESANNATVGGALIPLVAMGIPGSVIDTILLGALVIHGLQPGPLLLQQNPDVVYTIMGTLLFANLFMFIFMIFAARHLARLSDIPRWVLAPLVIVFCLIGSFALANRMFDVWVMLAFGLFGFCLERMGLPLAPLVIGFVLAPIAEEHLCAGLMQSGGSYLPMVQQPLSCLFCVVACVLLIWTLIRRKRMQTSQLNEPSETHG